MCILPHVRDVFRGLHSFFFHLCRIFMRKASWDHCLSSRNLLDMCATSTMWLHPTPPTHPNPTCYVASNMCATSTMSLHPTPPTHPTQPTWQAWRKMLLSHRLQWAKHVPKRVVTSDWSPKLTASTWKIDGWKILLVAFWDSAGPFSGVGLLLVSGKAPSYSERVFFLVALCCQTSCESVACLQVRQKIH